MGERSVEEPATPDEIAQIAKLAGDSVREGALGFSTNRHLGHLLPDGRCIPGTHAEHEEVRAIAAEVGRAGGIMQTVMNFQDMEKEMEKAGLLCINTTRKSSGKPAFQSKNQILKSKKRK